MINGFKEFILRGNVIDLAVAVVIGAAFSAIVTAVVNGIFNPLIGAIFNAAALSSLTLPLGDTGAEIGYGAVLAALINFVVVAIVLYFAFVLPINHVKQVAAAKKEAGVPAVTEATPPTELELLVDIRDLLANGGTPSAGMNHGKHTD